MSGYDRLPGRTSPAAAAERLQSNGLASTAVLTNCEARSYAFMRGLARTDYWNRASLVLCRHPIQLMIANEAIRLLKPTVA